MARYIALLLMGILFVNSPVAQAEKTIEDYWEESSIELSNLQYFVNNKNCYDDQKSFVACVAGLNGFAQGLKEHDEKFYPEEYLKTHADSISLEIKSYPDLILAQKNKTHNQESKDNPFS